MDLQLRGRKGINVNAVYPGATITEAVLERYHGQAKRQGRTLDAYLEELRQRSAIRHLVTAADVAQVAALGLLWIDAKNRHVSRA